jgi:predicted lipid carrier protein YhbT
VEACDYYNPVLLNLEEYSVRKAQYSRATAVPVDDRKLQWMFSYCRHRCETLSKLRANVVIPGPRVQQTSFASGTQTTGSITVS